jgi:hypothetical protein
MIGPRHADRHGGRGNDEANRKRGCRNQFDSGAAAPRNRFFGNRERVTDFPGQLSHDRHPSRISLRCSQFRLGCRRRFDRTWANLLKKKGNFVVLVNEGLTPQTAPAI